MVYKILKLLKSGMSLIIVALGVYLESFYINNDLSFTSVFCGIIGGLILLPAIFSWDKILGDKFNN